MKKDEHASLLSLIHIWLDVKMLGAVRYVKTTREHRIYDTSNAAEAYRAAGDATIRDGNKLLYEDPDMPGYPAKVVMPTGGPVSYTHLARR